MSVQVYRHSPHVEKKSKKDKICCGFVRHSLRLMQWTMVFIVPTLLKGMPEYTPINCKVQINIYVRSDEERNFI